MLLCYVSTAELFVIIGKLEFIPAPWRGHSSTQDTLADLEA